MNNNQTPLFIDLQLEYLRGKLLTWEHNFNGRHILDENTA